MKCTKHAHYQRSQGTGNTDQYISVNNKFCLAVELTSEGSVSL